MSAFGMVRTCAAHVDGDLEVLAHVFWGDRNAKNVVFLPVLEPAVVLII